VIAVLGATGTIGRHVVAGLTTRDVAFHCVGRPRADLRDPASLRVAFEGAERLFMLTPHGPDQDLLEAGAIDAAVAAGVQRIVKISGGAPSLGPNGPTSTAVAHWRSERRIERSLPAPIVSDAEPGRDAAEGGAAARADGSRADRDGRRA
jgi:uncharacterized protein YbjT (DUF2867 family)